MGTHAPVIAIDGPGGAGKGTVSHRLAVRLGYHLLDSGAIYRVLALAAHRAGLDAGRPDAVAALAAGLDLEFRPGTRANPVLPSLNGEGVADAIREEWCGILASGLAAIPGVREALVVRQRAFRRPPGLVADGRDMGTVVFPDAEVKIFLTASAEERARRRHKQLIEKGIDAKLAILFGEINERDRRDRERPVAPLKPAEDAAYIDTTGVDVDGVVDRVTAIVGEKISLGVRPGSCP